MPELDSLDRALLSLLQRNTRQTYSELAAKVHLSESSTRRRVDAMRSNGVIDAEVALVNPEMIGGVQVIVSVMFERESPELYAQFREHIRKLDCVQQCYSVAGDVDFVLIVHAPDLVSFERFGEQALMGFPGLRRYSSQVIWSRVKFSTQMPL
jgi:Lrp/AsnC family transcriptional regulator, leucine-responsive regulatory protein